MREHLEPPGRLSRLDNGRGSDAKTEGFLKFTLRAAIRPSLVGNAGGAEFGPLRRHKEVILF